MQHFDSPGLPLPIPKKIHLQVQEQYISDTFHLTQPKKFLRGYPRNIAAARKKAKNSPPEMDTRTDCQTEILFSPNKTIHNAGIALDDPRDLHGDVFRGIVWHWGAEFAVLLHLHCQVNGLQQLLRMDARQNKAALVQRLRALGGGADAHRRERLADRQVETRLLRQRAAVGHDAESVHLQAVVIVEAQWLVRNDAPVQLESAFL